MNAVIVLAVGVSFVWLGLTHPRAAAFMAFATFSTVTLWHILLGWSLGVAFLVWYGIVLALAPCYFAISTGSDRTTT